MNRIAPLVVVFGLAAASLLASWVVQSRRLSSHEEALLQTRAMLLAGDQGTAALRELEALEHERPDSALVRRVIVHVQQEVERDAAIAERVGSALGPTSSSSSVIATALAGVALLAIGTAFAAVAGIAGRAQRRIRRTEAALRSLRSLLAAAPLAFVAWCRERGVVLWSDSAERMFGLARARALGAPLAESLHGLRDTVERALAGGDNATALPVSLQNERGEPIHLSVSASRMELQEPGRPTIAVVVEDVTPHRERESRRLDAVRAQRDALIREVHHRIKNHLQGVAGLLRQHLGGKPLLRPVLEAATAQVLTIAAVHGLQGELRGAVLDLRNMVSRIAASISGIMRVPIVLDEGCAALEGACVSEDEAVAIAMVLNELLMNAVKHHPGAESEALVRVGAGRGIDEVAIHVRNPGSLPARFNFELGAQVGTGLGLVKSLLPQHGVGLKIAEEAGDVIATLSIASPHLLLANAPEPAVR